jgi:hypothetical protein
MKGMAGDPTPTEDQQPQDPQAPVPDEPAAVPADGAARADGEHPTPEAAAVESGVPQPGAGEPEAQEQPAAEQAAPEQPAAEQAAPEQPAPEQPAAEQAAPEQPAPEQAAPEQAAPEQPAAEQAAQEQQPATEQPAAEQHQAPQEAESRPGGQAKRRRNRNRRKNAAGGAAGAPGGPGGGRQHGAPRAPRGPRGQRQKLPLPFAELRAAAQALSDVHGSRQSLRDAFSVLAEKERNDLSRLVSEDGEWRVRARNIAAGSLGAGRVGKAMAAQVVSMAQLEDVWTVTLSKEEADQRLSRIRDAKQRDQRRRERMRDRDRRSDRVSREDLAKAQDGRVGAQIRIVLDEPREKRDKKGKERRQGTTEDLLSRLGY